MVKATLKGFNGIDTATFETTADDVIDVSVITATLLDDLVYTVYDAEQSKEQEQKDEKDDSEQESDNSLLGGLPVDLSNLSA